MILGAMFERRLPKQFETRESTLVPWQRFDSTAVLKVLRILGRAFAWTKDDVQRLRPEDKLWAIYYSYYPQQQWWQRIKPDELEMETVYRDLEREAPACALELHRPDVTVEDIVRGLAS